MIYSSNIGHSDVIDMREPWRKPMKLVEDGGHQRRDSSADPRVNERCEAVGHVGAPDSSKGTRVEKEAVPVLQRVRQLA